MNPIQIGVVMGSSSDWDTMQHAVAILQQFGIAFEAQVVSAHRMPDDMFRYAEAAAERGLKAIIAGAGGAAHLPGMIAAKTPVPVLGVPVASRHLQVWIRCLPSYKCPRACLWPLLPLAMQVLPTRPCLPWLCWPTRPCAARKAQRLPRRADRGRPQHDPAGERMSEARNVILPGATLGVLGGGQLGRMFAHAAQAMGYFTAVLDQDPTSPAGRVSHHHIRTGYEDPQGLTELAKLCAAVTTEFENVPAGSLNQLAQSLPVSPAGSAVAIAQDRAREKAHFVQCGVLSHHMP